MKSVIWVGSAKADLLAFPPDARQDVGYQLERVQRGEQPHDWKPMTTVGVGVHEIRVHESDGAFRVIYLAARPEGTYVLHCFQKKSPSGIKTAKMDVDLIAQRLKAARNDYEARYGKTSS